jgi:hypothetical protein
MPRLIYQAGHLLNKQFKANLRFSAYYILDLH